MEQWFTEAKKVSKLDAELCFLLKSDFYFGPDRHIEINDKARFTESLMLPDIPRAAPSMLRTAEAIGHEADLSAYYKQVVKSAIKHEMSFNSIRHHFWLRLWFWNSEEEIHVSFPWYDSYSEISRFLDALVSTESGLVDHDIEQGWEMEVYTYENQVFIRERDPDYDETHLCICVPRLELIQQAKEIMERSSKIIAALSASLGEDVWTKYVRTEPAFMSKPEPVVTRKKVWWKFW